MLAGVHEQWRIARVGVRTAWRATHDFKYIALPTFIEGI